jgi:bacillithiol system protein YtxJ
MEWKDLSGEEELNELIESSDTLLACIFKHSTRCPISTMVRSRLENGWKAENDNIIFYSLDVLKHRGLSDLIADKFSITHQSPQLIILKNGKVVHDASHTSISPIVIENLV